MMAIENQRLGYQSGLQADRCGRTNTLACRKTNLTVAMAELPINPFKPRWLSINDSGRAPLTKSPL